MSPKDRVVVQFYDTEAHFLGLYGANYPEFRVSYTPEDSLQSLRDRWPDAGYTGVVAIPLLEE